MMLNTKWLIAICIAAFLTGCSTPKDLVFKEYKNLKLQNLGFSDAVLAVDLVYYNPNNIGLQLSRTDLDLYVDSAYLGHSTQDVQINVGARKEFTLPLRVNVDLKNLLKNGLNSLTSKEVAVRLVGNVKVGKGGIYKTFKVDYTSMQNFSMFR